MDVLTTIGGGFKDAFLMAWEVWWALVLGFAISAIVQAWVPRANGVGVRQRIVERQVGAGVIGHCAGSFVMDPIVPPTFVPSIQPTFLAMVNITNVGRSEERRV